MSQKPIGQTNGNEGSIYVEGHRRMKGWSVGVGKSRQYVSSCECGWSSALAMQELRANALHGEHAAEQEERAAIVLEQDAVEEYDPAELDEHGLPRGF